MKSGAIAVIFSLILILSIAPASAGLFDWLRDVFRQNPPTITGNIGDCNSDLDCPSSYYDGNPYCKDGTDLEKRTIFDSWTEYYCAFPGDPLFSNCDSTYYDEWVLEVCDIGFICYLGECAPDPYYEEEPDSSPPTK